MDIRRTVLLADANEEFRTLVRKIIDEAEEFSVVGSVGDGTEALRLAREEAPDLILMDVVLPGLDGFGVLKQLREQEGKVPKVILISAFCSASATTVRVVSQISMGLCSTQPGFGKIWVNSCWPTATISPAWLKMIARVEVVPWSMARTNISGVVMSVLSEVLSRRCGGRAWPPARRTGRLRPTR